MDLPELTVADVAARLGESNFYVFDNNGPGRWRRGHVPGAVNLDAHNYDASELPADRSATLVFYCSGRGCRSCSIAARRASELGYPNVFVMPEGIAGWENASRPIETG
ncbi:MAG: rhodanese-like domain-containing protein [Kofleriaceae bacterium]